MLTAARRTVLASLCALVLAAVGAAALPAAPSAPAGANVRGLCRGVSAIDVYFWPRGHDAVPEIGFGAFPVPHLEFYRARDASNPGYLASSTTRGADFSAACTSVADRAMPASSALTAPSGAQTKLRCEFTGEAELRVGALTRVVKQTRIVRVRGQKRRRVVRKTIRLGNVASAAVSGSPNAIVVAHIKASGSTLRWDSRVCAPVPLAG